MIVVDTNIIVYLYISGEHSQQTAPSSITRIMRYTYTTI